MIESGSLLCNTYTHHTSAPVLPAPAALYRSRRLCVGSLSFLFIFSSSVIFWLCRSSVFVTVMAAGHWDDVNEETSAADTRSETPKGRTHLLFASVCMYVCC